MSWSLILVFHAGARPPQPFSVVVSVLSCGIIYGIARGMLDLRLIGLETPWTNLRG